MKLLCHYNQLVLLPISYLKFESTPDESFEIKHQHHVQYYRSKVR